MILCVAVPRADGPVRTGLYVPPVNAFIIDPAETPIALDFGAASIADIQNQVDAARAGDPDSPIVLTLSGDYPVTDAPLALSSKTCSGRHRNEPDRNQRPKQGGLTGAAI